MTLLNKKEFEFDSPMLFRDDENNNTCNISRAWIKVKSEHSLNDKHFYRKEIKKLLKKKNAILVAHYYVDEDLQELAIETNGCVGDSLEMARFGADHLAQTLIVAGVKFMGETAKILSPNKVILMPDLEATCSLELGCPADVFDQFCRQHSDREIVVYANTSAAVKARADWVVTSSIALDVVSYLHQKGKKILWAPDRHLGSYIQRETGADMLLWQGSCIVHNEFKASELRQLKKKYPEAIVLAHPESPKSVIDEADIVGSTSKLLTATYELDKNIFIVATDLGILHQMRKKSPHKIFLAAPTSGESATCKSCAFCPWMAMNSLMGVYQSLLNDNNSILLDSELMKKAKLPITRMLDFSKNKNIKVETTGNFIKDHDSLGKVGFT